MKSSLIRFITLKITLLFALWDLSLAQYALNYADSSILIGASQDCLDAYTANVSCTSAIGSLYADQWPDFNETVLGALCSDTCFDSLTTHRNNVSSQCASDVTFYNVADSSSWPVTYRTDQAIHNYNMTCVKRSDGNYCNSWFQDGANVTDTPECDECYMDIVYMQAVSPVEGDIVEMQSIYASLTSSCGYTGPAATATVTGLAISSPTATLSCTSEYTIQAGDTFLGVSQSHQVATHDLCTANSLNYNLTDFPTSGNLCIRNQCSVYVVQVNDTCEGIATGNSLTLAKLHSWNAQINGVCDNLADLVNQTICTSNPLGDYTVVSVNTTAAASFTTAAPVPTDVAPDTLTDCGEYYSVDAGQDCGTIEFKYSVSLKDFLFLNPEVWDNCTNLWANTSYCVAPVGYISTYSGYSTPTATFSITPESSTAIAWYDPFASDGTAPDVPLANSTRTDCWDYTWWNTSLSTLPSCWDVAASSDITGEELVLWNPSLEANASLTVTPDNVTATVYDYPCTISASQSYCVAIASPTSAVTTTTAAPPSPRASGEASNCTNWFVGVLDCASHLSLLRMDIATLYSMNPSVKADCSGYVLGTYYCDSTNADGSVAVTSETITTTATATTTSSSTGTATGITTPTPTQTGMVSNCGNFYLVQSGDGCWAIANANGISLDDFYAWNPAVGTDCADLWPTYYVCVGLEAAPISSNGLCGGSDGMTCAGSAFGDCCSSSGYCGSSSDYCSVGCQTAFGTCDASSGDVVSPDGTCGGTDAYTCAGSQFGTCCSSSGYCGSTSDYCDTGCQDSFGTCT
ncbi:muramidase [Xylariales sp. AK1849]|nr:muramidase [Xylariales sp. AK1849]